MRKFKSIQVRAGALAIAVSLITPSVAYAQTPVTPKEPESVLGEITVTAQKREQKSQDVGIAIAAISGSQLRALNVVDSRDIAQLTPGVHISGNLAGLNVQYTIRGVAQNDFSDISEAPNAVYLDEGYIAVGQGQSFATFDIDRVEVLKGPQGTLFGRNATGGLVHFVTTKPTFDRVKGYAEVRGGLFDTAANAGVFHGEAALNIPLTDTLAIRFGGQWNKQGAFIKNLYPAGAVGAAPWPGAGANLGDNDTISGRFTALYQPSSSAKLTLSINAAHTKTGTAPYQNKATVNVFDAKGELVDVVNAAPNETRASICANGQDCGSDMGNTGHFGAPYGRPVPGGDFFGYIAPGGWNTSSDFSFKNVNHIDTFGANLTGEFNIASDITLTSVTDYKQFKKLVLDDVDGGPENQLINYAGLDAHTVTQELRLNGKAENVTWATGLYYLYMDNRNIFGLGIPPNSTVPGGPIDIGLNARLVSNSYSAFGQIDWKFAPKFTVVIGARIVQEEKSFNFRQGLWSAPNPLLPQPGEPFAVIGPNNGAPYAAKSGQTLWAGKFQLEYRPVGGLLLYAGVNRGVKAGSFNAPLAGGLPITVDYLPYKAEVLYNYEGGFKYTFPDGKTRLNASAFYYDYKNYQAFLFTGVSGVVINAPDKTYGIEGELRTSPIRGLDIGLTAAYTHATVEGVPLRLGGPYTRNVQPTYSPRVQANAIVRYGWEALGGRFSVGGDVDYTGKFYYNLRNFTADQVPGTWMVNTSVDYKVSDWTFTAAIKNLTNVRVGVIGFDLAGLCGCNQISYKPPRLFSFSARYEF
ncbi:TonB-dependent receptor [Novosphingobium humi]|uniref:TonB-dependent receptor n=1 Tax=Novosphingobium humi TaxID=2282397 RepID=A0ABY7U457_9SPHN|nr:TonB-dependent receptor [Novosphingobium humi]WCT79139.1 TonB-dependent receptor [Novosphingobium humi]